MDDWNAAREASNWTAASQFARLAGQSIGSLTDNVRLTDDRPSAEQLINRLGNNDPELAALLRKRLSARDAFDA